MNRCRVISKFEELPIDCIATILSFSNRVYVWRILQETCKQLYDDCNHIDTSWGLHNKKFAFDINNAIENLSLIEKKKEFVRNVFIMGDYSYSFLYSLSRFCSIINIDIVSKKNDFDFLIKILTENNVYSSNNIRSLNLHNNNISDNGAISIAIALKKNNTLTSLDLSWDKIGINGIIAIANALEKNNTLTSLNLCGNKSIEDVGAIAIAKMLEINNSLTSLDLCWNEIGEIGTNSIIETLKNNNTLTFLYLVGNHFDCDYIRGKIDAILEKRNKKIKVIL